jgi:hypothetical protein
MQRVLSAVAVLRPTAQRAARSLRTSLPTTQVLLCMLNSAPAAATARCISVSAVAGVARPPAGTPPPRRTDEVGDLLDILGASDDEEDRKRKGGRGGRVRGGGRGGAPGSGDAAASSAAAGGAGGRNAAGVQAPVAGPAMNALVDADGAVLPLASEDEDAAPHRLPDEIDAATARRAARQLAYHRRSVRATSAARDVEEYAAALERELGSDVDEDVAGFERAVRQDEYAPGTDPLLEGE